MKNLQRVTGASTDQGIRARQQARYARRAMVAERDAWRDHPLETALLGMALYVIFLLACV